MFLNLAWNFDHVFTMPVFSDILINLLTAWFLHGQSLTSMNIRNYIKKKAFIGPRQSFKKSTQSPNKNSILDGCTMYQIV